MTRVKIQDTHDSREMGVCILFCILWQMTRAHATDPARH